MKAACARAHTVAALRVLHTLLGLRARLVHKESGCAKAVFSDVEMMGFTFTLMNVVTVGVRHAKLMFVTTLPMSSALFAGVGHVVVKVRKELSRAVTPAVPVSGAVAHGPLDTHGVGHAVRTRLTWWEAFQAAPIVAVMRVHTGTNGLPAVLGRVTHGIVHTLLARAANVTRRQTWKVGGVVAGVVGHPLVAENR